MLPILELVSVHPDLLEAGRRPAHTAIRKTCGLDRESGGQDECQGGDGYCGDTDEDRILGTSHHAHHVCVSFLERP